MKRRPEGVGMNNTKSAEVKFSKDNHCQDAKVWKNTLLFPLKKQITFPELFQFRMILMYAEHLYS